MKFWESGVFREHLEWGWNCKDVYPIRYSDILSLCLAVIVS